MTLFSLPAASSSLRMRNSEVHVLGGEQISGGHKQRRDLHD